MDKISALFVLFILGIMPLKRQYASMKKRPRGVATGRFQVIYFFF